MGIGIPEKSFFTLRFFTKWAFENVCKGCFETPFGNCGKKAPFFEKKGF